MFVSVPGKIIKNNGISRGRFFKYTYVNEEHYISHEHQRFIFFAVAIVVSVVVVPISFSYLESMKSLL